MPTMEMLQISKLDPCTTLGSAVVSLTNQSYHKALYVSHKMRALFITHNIHFRGNVPGSQETQAW